MEAMEAHGRDSTEFKVKDSVMKFLVFEGLDGSGKSSLIRALEAELTKRQIEFLRTREPGGSPLGDELRGIILRKTSPHPVAKAELLLYQAARAQHVEETIRPSLAQGRWVISDRFSASSVAFQAGGRMIAKSDVEWLNRFATSGLDPDLIILLDLSVAEAQNRQSRRQRAGGGEQDRIEAEPGDFHERVRQGFLEQAKQSPQSWLVLRAELSPEELQEQLFSELKRRKWLP